MKLILTLILLSAICSLCVAKTHLHKPKTELDFNKMGYGSLRLFVYKVNQIEPTTGHIIIDTLGLFCSPVKLNMTGQYLMQWQSLTRDSSKYKIPENKYNNAYTGIDVNDSFLFIHPAREHFRVLEFCPYPYFKKKNKIGSTWSWSLDIGGLWAIDSLYPLKNNELEHVITDYLFKDTVTLNTIFGNLFCFKIIAKANSKSGSSYATYYLNNEYGLINIEVTAINGMKYQFDLISVIRNEDSNKFNKEFIWQADRARNKKANYLNFGIDATK